MVHPILRSVLSSSLLRQYRNREGSHKRRLEDREVLHFVKKVYRPNTDTFFYIARDWFLACGELRIASLRLHYVVEFMKALILMVNHILKCIFIISQFTQQDFRWEWEIHEKGRVPMCIMLHICELSEKPASS